MECFYPNNMEDAYKEGFAHSCDDCEPRLLVLDRYNATERQKLRRTRINTETGAPEQKPKRPPSKSRSKKTKPTDLTKPNPEDIARLKQIDAEVSQQYNQEVLEDVPTHPQQYAETAQGIKKYVNEMDKVGKVLGKWYSLTHDDDRARNYFIMVSFYITYK